MYLPEPGTTLSLPCSHTTRPLDMVTSTSPYTNRTETSTRLDPQGFMSDTVVSDEEPTFPFLPSYTFVLDLEWCV
jgi:hypothetical protein